MATASVAIQQQIPHMPITHVPRVRPPRIPKGTPNANTNPQPEGPLPHNAVWAQGKWRNPASNAVKDRKAVQSRRVEKALRREDHGQNIFAYAHIRTKQVVYSLTRIMNNNNIMKQLVFHGKKTVPAALRRDVWTPYFSLHFPANECGRSAGLLAYKRLREFALQRQLSPPEDMIRTTQADLDRLLTIHGDPLSTLEMRNRGELRLPSLGQILPPKLRAKKLMDQKMTSVADLAFILDLQATGPTPEEAAKLRAERNAAWWDNISKGRRQRIRRREPEKLKTEEILAARRALVQKPNPGALGLDRYSAIRIATERQAKIVSSDEVLLDWKADLQRQIDELNKPIVEKTPSKNKPSNIKKTSKSEKGDSPPTSTALQPSKGCTSIPPSSPPPPSDKPLPVRVLWADLRDAAYAAYWPKTVVHGELERYATTWFATPGVGGIQETRMRKSVHVHGAEKGHGLVDEREVMMQKLEEARQGRQERVADKSRWRERGGVPSSAKASVDSKYRRLEEVGVAALPKSLWQRFTGVFGR